MDKLKKGIKTLLSELYFPMLAILLGLFVGALAMIWVGYLDGLPVADILLKPLKGYKVLLQSVFGSLYDFGETIFYFTPLVMTGLAIAFSFRSGMFNIGAEGQFIVGSFVTAYVGFTFNNWPTWLQFSVAIIAGTVAGGLWGAFAGFLKAKRGVHEVITTIMLNHIAFHLYNFFVSDPAWFKAENFQGSFAINPEIRIPKIALFEPSRAHYGIFFAIVAAIIVYIILWKTKLGYEIRAVGFNQDAAKYAGINVPARFIVSMFISGALSAMGGSLHLLGASRRAMQLGSFVNFGFDGIAVALIGRNNPWGVLLSAFLFSMLKRGAPVMQAQAGIAKEVVAIVQAAIIFFVAADQIVKFLVRRFQKPVEEGQNE